MPKAALKPCAHPSCKKLVHYSNRFCEVHEKANQKAVDANRGTAHQRGYTRTWRDAREQYLRLHPLCVACYKLNFITPAKEVDHIVPHKGDMKLFWDQTNWQGLCKPCHSAKTATEDGGFGRWKKRGAG